MRAAKSAKASVLPWKMLAIGRIYTWLSRCFHRGKPECTLSKAVSGVWLPYLELGKNFLAGQVSMVNLIEFAPSLPFICEHGIRVPRLWIFPFKSITPIRTPSNTFLLTCAYACSNLDRIKWSVKILLSYLIASFVKSLSVLTAGDS